MNEVCILGSSLRIVNQQVLYGQTPAGAFVFFARLLGNTESVCVVIEDGRVFRRYEYLQNPLLSDKIDLQVAMVRRECNLNEDGIIVHCSEREWQAVLARAAEPSEPVLSIFDPMA
jgi:hypothetical protein